MPPIDPAQARPVKELKHDSPLIACRFDPAGEFVFASAQDSTIQRWDLKEGKKVAFKGHASWVRGLACHPKEKVLFTAGYEGKVVAWPSDAAEPRPLFTASTFHVYNLAFHPNGQTLASGDLKGVVKVWDLVKGTAERELDAKVLAKYDETFRADIGGVRSMAFSADGGLLACAGITEVTNAFAGVGKPAVVLFDFATGQRKQLLAPKEPFQGTAWGVGFHSEGWIIGVGGGSGGALWFWKADQAAAAVTVKLPNNARDLDLSADGTQLAVPFFDSVLRVYDLTPKDENKEPKKP